MTRLLPILFFLLLVRCLPADAGLPRPTLFDDRATPAPILRGIIATESSMRPNVTGDDGLSRGGAQLNRKYDRERADRWGAFDPYNLADAIRITDRLFQANLYALQLAEGCIDPSTWERKREDIAIGAHRRGLWGALTHGADGWYLDRVRRMGR